MICVECGNPDIACLHSEFKSKFIQLTVCPKCGKLADKYVEFDNVLLFLDVLLLKPQAYRHVAFNLVEETMFSENVKENLGLLRYRSLSRFVVLSTLFEVYLKWAYEEKNTSHSNLKSLVLAAPPPIQYAFFIAQQLVEKYTLCVLVVFLYLKVLRWGTNSNGNIGASDRLSYNICVLLVSILVSLAVKSLPIIMLIWPYDNAAVASTAVEVLGVFNMIEALRMNTDCSYLSTSLIAVVATVCSILVKNIVMCCVVGYFSSKSPLQLWDNQWTSSLSELKSLASLVVSVISSPATPK